jgi:hypothetical protein
MRRLSCQNLHLATANFTAAAASGSVRATANGYRVTATSCHMLASAASSNVYATATCSLSCRGCGCNVHDHATRLEREGRVSSLP